MTKLIDLEQNILKCWNIVEDLQMLAEQVNNGSDFTKVLKGTAELYHYKFEAMWADFEEVTSEYYAMRDKADGKNSKK